jgi:hypothetical protein
MKSDTTTTALNLILAALVILGVIFALLSIMRTRELRAITPVAMQVNSKMLMIQSLIGDVNNYNQQAKSPEVARMLQTLQTKISTIK